MSTPRRPTTTEYAVLGLLGFGEQSGSDLARFADQSVGYMWAPSRSQIYKVLPRLVAAGWARTRAVEQQGRPDKALHKVTPAGLEALQAWLEDVEDEPVDGHVVFALKLFFCDFASPDTALAHLSAYRSYLTHRLDAYEEIEACRDDSARGYHDYVLGHGLARVRATLAWIDETTAAIDSSAALENQIVGGNVTVISRPPSR
jgi:PadR family transcriptional regulator AphA